MSQIAESRRHLRRESGSLTFRRLKKKARTASSKREMDFSRRRPLFLVLLFLLTQFYFMRSPLFEFRELEISGAISVPEEAIESRLGLPEKANFWEISPQSLQANLANLHRLEEADVKVTFPGRVQVQVEERKPSFFVASINRTNNWYTADKAGVILESSSPNSRSLRFLLSYPVRSASQVKEKDLQIVHFFQDHLDDDLRQKIRVIKIGQDQELALRVNYGAEPIWVRLGRPERLPYKLFLLQELTAQLTKEKEKILSIDLRYSAPVVRKEVKEVEKTQEEVAEEA